MNGSNASNLRRTSTLRAFSHLSVERRVPTEYELSTSDLLWYPQMGGFEVRVPLGEWYERHQRGSLLKPAAWDTFVDPRETTYAKYVAQQRTREENVDAVLRLAVARDYDATLARDWVSTLERVLPAMRYPAHAMQMVAAYVGQMAPAGRVLVACALQAADEARRIQRLVERSILLRRAHPGFGVGARRTWESDAVWQPTREVMEHLLVAWDWGEAFAALNLCVAPLFDRVLMTGLSELGRTRSDPLLVPFLASLDEDCAWHREWSGALCSTALAGHDGNRAVIEGWVRKWVPQARGEVRALDAVFQPDSLADAAVREHDEWLASLGLTPP